MKKSFAVISGIASLIFLAPALFGQAEPAAVVRSQLKAGLGVLYLNNDYNTQHANQGIAVWADYDITHLFGLEAEANFGGLHTPDDIGENTYLVGPRVLYRRRRYLFSAKILFGRGTITQQLLNQSSSYNLYAVGLGAEYSLIRKIHVRVDGEVQKWPSFTPNSLSPKQISVGLMYVIK